MARRHLTTQKEFADKLVNTARRYFDGDWQLNTTCGICFVTNEYHLMVPLMRKIGYRGTFGPYTIEREAWAKRAWMCLFLAAIIKQGV